MTRARGDMIHGIGRRTYGVTLVALSAVLWSTAGLFVRMANLDTWTIVGWRSLFAAVTLGTFACFHSRSTPRALCNNLRGPAIVPIAISVVSSICYIFSLKLTTVANVMTIYATLPFVATAIAYFWHGETVNRRFILACTATLLGIGIMTGAAATARDIWGILAALVMTSGFATQLVYSKHHAELDMSVIVAAAASICVLIALPLMQTSVPSRPQLFACALYGVLTTGIAYVLVLAGGRYLSSGEAGFVSLIDVILGPLWVWLLYAETPSTVMLIGGSIVLASVVWYLMYEFKDPTPGLTSTNVSRP